MQHVLQTLKRQARNDIIDMQPKQKKHVNKGERGDTVEDKKIIELFWQRDETAVKETQKKYSLFCRSIAYRILSNEEDATECENDTYLRVWNTVPPKCPNVFAAYLGTITRNLSLDKLRKNRANKRSTADAYIPLVELEECIPDTKSIDDMVETAELARLISDFLRTLPEHECNIFLCRYWAFMSINEICAKYGYSQSKVKSMLMRTRQKLLAQLEKEGIFA